MKIRMMCQTVLMMTLALGSIAWAVQMPQTINSDKDLKTALKAARAPEDHARIAAYCKAKARGWIPKQRDMNRPPLHTEAAP